MIYKSGQSLETKAGLQKKTRRQGTREVNSMTSETKQKQKTGSTGMTCRNSWRMNVYLFYSRGKKKNKKTKQKKNTCLNTQGLVNGWNTGVHRWRAGKRQKQEMKSHNETHEDDSTVKQEILKLKTKTVTVFCSFWCVTDTLENRKQQ